MKWVYEDRKIYTLGQISAKATELLTTLTDIRKTLDQVSLNFCDETESRKSLANIG
jgi:hypothetical protein